MVVNDWWVVVGDKQYEMRTIEKAEPGIKRYPVHWGQFAKEWLAVFLGVTVIVLAGIPFHINMGGTYVYWALDCAYDAYKYKGKSIQYTLVLQTLMGRIEAAALGDGTYILIIADEINKRISKTQSVPLAQQAGLQATREERHYPKANVVLNDSQILTGTDRYNLSDISYAEVVTRRYPVDWRSFIQEYTVLFLGVAAIWAIATSFGWVSIVGPAVAVLWLLITLYAAHFKAKSAYKHTLALQTRSGTIETATSDDDNSLLEACEAINRRIKRSQAIQHPLQPTEQTRQILTR